MSNMDEKSQSIAYQNQSHLALALLIHNSNGAPIDYKDVVLLTKRLALNALNPRLDAFAEQLKKEKGK